MTIRIEGTHEPQFAGVADTFRSNFERGLEVGASLCVYLHGRPVVDLWGGLADPTSGKPWQRDSITVLASTTKAMTATAALLLVQRGQLDLDAPVAHYWPEFAAQAKAGILVRWLLAHRAGVVTLDPPITLDDQLQHVPVAARIAAQSPCWEPGTAHGYHAVTFGWTVSELIRRITGVTAGGFFRREIARPLALDLHIGLPDSEVPRVAPMIGPTQEEALRGFSNPQFADFNRALADPASLLFKATFGATSMSFADAQNPRRYLVEEPSGAGLGNAASLARMFAALIGEVDGMRLFDSSTMEKARSIEASGLDQVLRLQTHWGLGYMLPGGPMWRAFGARAFGHGGASGSLAFADPENGLAFGYVPNKWAELAMGGGERFVGLIEATYRSLALGMRSKS